MYSKKSGSFFLLDLLILSFAFLFILWLKPGGSLGYVESYFPAVFWFLLIWIACSFICKKYNIHIYTRLVQVNSRILTSNFISLSVIMFLMYMLRELHFSRLIVLGTFVMATVLELATGNLAYYFIKTRAVKTNGKSPYPGSHVPFEPSPPIRAIETIALEEQATVSSHLDEFFIEEYGREVFYFVTRHLDIHHPRTLLISTTTRFNILKQADRFYQNMVNLKRINDIREINRFFEAINAKLPINGFFINHVETKNQRKERLLLKYPPGLNYIYYFFDFILKRVFPKFALTKGIYFFLTRGNNQVLTRAETYGRLYSCGFELVDEQKINNQLYFVARKKQQPYFDPDPSYGPIIKLRRIGKNGKYINVYKLRTMHPYAEYLQDFVFQKNYLKEGGKFHDDFRISTLGKIFRTLWLDELPMLVNLMKGDVKIVGVRPLSEHYFNLYMPELREKRVRYKPGLIPPFYADMPKTLDEIMASEMKYLQAYEKRPLLTDTRYFFLAIYNIIFRNARSS